MEKLLSLFLASAILFSAKPLSANDQFYKSIWQIVAFLGMYTTYTLYSENQDLKAKLEEAQANQQKQKESILNKDKTISPEPAK